MLDLEVTPNIFAPRFLLEIKSDKVRAQGTSYRAKSTCRHFQTCFRRFWSPHRQGGGDIPPSWSLKNMPVALFFVMPRSGHHRHQDSNSQARRPKQDRLGVSRSQRTFPLSRWSCSVSAKLSR